MPAELDLNMPPAASAAYATERIVAYRFGPFRLRLDGRILERNGELVRVTPKVADTLLVLIERAGEVVSKEQLMAAVWPDVVVVESGLTRNISMLRQALECDGAEGKYIETLPRRGYRFVGDLEIERQPLGDAAVAQGPEAVPTLQEATPSIPFSPRAALRRATPWLIAATLLLASLGITSRVLPREPARAAAHSQNADVQIGKHLLAKLTPAEASRAHEYFQRAIVADPSSAEAHAGAALALVQLTALGGVAPHLAIPEVQSLAKRALHLEEGNALALAASGAALLIKGQDLAQADRYYRRALEREPNSVTIRYGYSYLKLALSDLDGARALIEEALRIDPASPRIGTQYGTIFYYQRDYLRAAEEFRRVLHREPGYALAHYYLALSLGFLGEADEALANLDASRLNPDVLATDRVWLLAMRGDPAPARELLAERQHLVESGKLDASVNLLLAATLGEKDLATAAIEAANATAAVERMTIHLEPRLDSLRGLPGFGAVQTAETARGI